MRLSTLQKTLTLFSLLGLVLASSVLAEKAQPEARPITLQSVLDHYESVRTALVMDAVEETALPAQSIVEALAALHHHFDPQTAAVDAGSKDKAKGLLGKMHVAATTMAKATQAGNLAATRDAFYELSKPMVQYRELMIGDKPVVAYCPMEKKSWLQDDDAIGNPYAGQSMPTCGSVVAGGASAGR